MKRICLGKITGAHGVKGLVKLSFYGENHEILEQISPLYTSKSGDKTLCLTLKNPMGKYWLASVEGVDDRDKAENISGVQLWVSRDKLPQITDEDEFYIEDLVGLKAVDASGAEIGIVAAIPNFGAGDLLELRLKAGGDILLQFTKENVPEINIDDKMLIVNLPEDAKGEQQ